MADSTVFDRVCAELESRTSLDRLAVRGTIRIALKNAGLEAAAVDAAQMGVVLRKLVPAELASRGVADAPALCDQIAEEIAGLRTEGVRDRAAEAAATIGRFGS